MRGNTIKPGASKVKAMQKLYSELKGRAENKLAAKPGAKSPERTLEEIVHDLEGYQIELEMQNEELRRAQVALEESSDRYIDFYDFAPVGYITLGSNGKLNEINLTGATMLGEERDKLLNRSFLKYITPEYRDRWLHHLNTALVDEKKLTCELVLQRKTIRSWRCSLIVCA